MPSYQLSENGSALLIVLQETKQVGLLDLRVTRERLYEQVVQQLQELITSRKLQPGDKLPPERRLAEQSGVSRTVIREAIKALEERGLVRTLTGSGTYVSQIDTQAISNSIGLFMQQRTSSFEHLYEIRRMLEVEIAGLAAQRATDQDILLLQGAIRDMEEAVAGVQRNSHLVEDFVRADLAFHNTLAKATQNPLLPVMLEPISDLLLEFRRKASSAPGAPADALAYHRKILEHVKGREVSTCQELMREHLVKAEEWASLATG